MTIDAVYTADKTSCIHILNTGNYVSTYFYLVNMSSKEIPYDSCPKCGQQWNNSWCGPCEIHLFQENFDKWTSGNPNVDAFIQETQLNATGFHDYLEWIPYEHLQDVKPLSEGGFAKVYSATWINDERTRWESNSSIKIALKCPRNQEEINQLLGEIRAYVSCAKYSHSSKVADNSPDGVFGSDSNYTRDSNVLPCYGITHDPSRGYMMVSEYAPYGDLHSYLKENRKLQWYDKLFILRDIIKGLAVIHNTGLLHGDLHPGNVLQKNDNKKKRSNLACAMLSNVGPAYEDYNWSASSVSPPMSHDAYEISGVIPYMAPELLRSKGYTKATDIYSFAMIMSEIASGEQPFSGRCHDAHLILDICEGLRPIVSGPECFIELLEKCWDVDPAKRPSANEVYDILEEWVNGLDEPDDSDSDFVSIEKVKKFGEKANSEIIRQFLFADDETKQSQPQPIVIHQGAVYTSRPLTEYITRAFECEIDFDDSADHDTASGNN